MFSHSGGQPQLLHQELPYTVQANGRDLLDVFFHVASSRPGILPHKSLHGLQGMLVDDCLLPLALVPVRDRAGRRDLVLARRCKIEEWW